MMDNNTATMTASRADALSLKVLTKKIIAQDIFLFELTDPDGAELPPFSAGAHVAITAPNGLLRRYSLCNDPAERGRYVIAVKRDAGGGGGSISMADEVVAGSRLQVAPPENYFALVPDAGGALLIAGGIGITPIMAMARELLAKGVEFKLVYCSRSPETTAFLQDLSAPELAARTQIHHDYGDPARSLALAPILATRPAGGHLYCCGPRALMQAVREHATHWPPAAVHFEDFGTSLHVAEKSGEKPFSVRLARSGLTAQVPPGVSILEALRHQGYAAPSSCESGTCGSCRTRLLAGVALHRDFVLDEDEHETDIMICVSRAQSEELVLDL